MTRPKRCLRGELLIASYQLLSTSTLLTLNLSPLASMREDTEQVIALGGLKVVNAEDGGKSISALGSTSALSELEGGASVSLGIDMKGIAEDSTSAIASSVDVSNLTQCSPRTHEFYILPIPNHLRHDPTKPQSLPRLLHYIFAITCTIFAANLYYCQPLLIQLSISFGVSYNQVSNIPTLSQAGYVVGLFLIAPLGDLVRRRPLILILTTTTLALSIGIAFNSNFTAYQVLSILVGIVNGVSQILVPFTAELAAPERRGSAISLLVSGMLLGILYARIIAGVIAQYVSWRVVYYVATGLQGANILVLYLTVPDCPVRNVGLTYFSVLRSTLKYAVTEPTLIQASLVSMVSMACFTNFWVTLTFLLSGSPYNYPTIAIGLFGLVGVFGILLGPLIGRTIDHLLPWTAALIATAALIVFQAIQTGAGGVHIAAVVVVCLGIDVFRQMQYVSLNTIVVEIEPAATARMNAVFQISVFAGQMMGTASGTAVFLKYGWRPAAALSLAWAGFTLLVMLLRGPHCGRHTWYGYEGGRHLRKPKVVTEICVQEATGDRDLEIAFEGLPAREGEAAGP